MFCKNEHYRPLDEPPETKMKIHTSTGRFKRHLRPGSQNAISYFESGPQEPYGEIFLQGVSSSTSAFSKEYYSSKFL
jgi:hypothetical protein